MIDQARLAESLGRLDAGTRALLDLSLRRAIPDDQVAKVLGADPASIPPRRARGIAQLADMMEVPGPAELAALLIAIPDLPEEAWDVPAPVPFAGRISRARRATAFRRVAVAASPLVALGAVMAALLVSSDHSGGGPGPGAAQRVAAGAGASAGAGAGATAPAPDARHALPAGVQLTLVHPGSARRAGHAARHHRARRIPSAAEPAILARHPAKESAPRSIPVAFHPAPVVHNEPGHVPQRHIHIHTHTHTHAKPKAPTSTPVPAPVHTPKRPVSSPAPSTPATPPVQLSAPVTHTAPTPSKPTKTPPPQPGTSAPHEGDEREGGCGDDDGESRSGGDRSSGHGSRHADSSQAQSGGGRPWTPPGLFRKHHGH